MTTPTQQDREKAAQIWCEPKHSHKEMDTDFAESIAQALAAERTRVIEELRAWAEANSGSFTSKELLSGTTFQGPRGVLTADLLAQLDAMAAQEPKEGEPACEACTLRTIQDAKLGTRDDAMECALRMKAARDHYREALGTVMAIVIDDSLSSLEANQQAADVIEAALKEQP